ncbi:hypothetical protein ASE17_13085 [Phenylobacterium sp. Root77]|uniref:DUF4440 domain-containing protein n=1 Tax=unclassified Phenylobacterium TaxID=2640670 RepID=UPI0006F39481|nr:MULTISPECIES: nuclear transport factor 2 family protein [unclassified Phenylobacterium]KQW69163.1 hypothetical protein ASC73_14550 [Phenylobacterium sp. Root1277]KQW95471.1 hypothetical protein ASC79_07135 [Phenylobacterium sp. Root1290]KRC41261.1 hypothetical protein ASE17_13085 [Phenylobacterium sp. Root77]
MKACSLILAALLVSTPALAEVDPSPVVAAERAFAADGLALGIKRSFLKHSTPDAVLLAPDPVTPQKLYGPRPDKPHPPLVWWPLWAGIARSGDLGFTTGPTTFGGKDNGWYFTVWARQADGGWKWIYDGGAPSAHGDAAPQGSDPAYLAASTGPEATPAAAMDAVRQAEAELALAAATDSAAAYLAVLAPDARVVGSPAVPATTPAAVKAELAARAGAIAFSPLGGRASQAGDLVWTYGDARWTEGSKDRRGHYVRIWQSRADGWRLVFDQILPVADAA